MDALNLGCIEGALLLKVSTSKGSIPQRVKVKVTSDQNIFKNISENIPNIFSTTF
jgi:hypothetical protein